jgi:uncharacterized membrane protein YhaH (DUF805 family)
MRDALWTALHTDPVRFLLGIILAAVLFSATMILVKRWKDFFFPPPPRHSVIWIR